MQTKFILPCLLSTLFFLNSLSSSAQNRKTIETTTDILMFITPVAGFAGSLAIGDYQGTKQIIFSGATNLAMTYALKYVIRKERPDHSDHHAFPSSHTSVSFQGASFIQRRYLTVIGHTSDFLADIYTVKYGAYLHFTVVLNAGGEGAQFRRNGCSI